jgi:hypothetical protein
MYHFSSGFGSQKTMICTFGPLAQAQSSPIKPKQALSNPPPDSKTLTVSPSLLADLPVFAAF